MSSLESRVTALEETEAVKREMCRVGRWLDRLTLTHKEEDIKEFVYKVMTKDGYFETEPFGNFGPDKAAIVAKLLELMPSIQWAVHYYLHQDVKLELDKGLAHFHAMEMVPLVFKGKATWLFLENTSDLKKEDGKWKLHKYGLVDAKFVDNSADVWPDFQPNPKARMFADP